MSHTRHPEVQMSLRAGSLAASVAQTAAIAAPEGQRRRPLDCHQLRGQDGEIAADHLRKGNCRCKRQCHSQVPLAELLAVRTFFWQQPADLRAHLLRSLYEAALAEGCPRHPDVEGDDSAAASDAAASGRLEVPGVSTGAVDSDSSDTSTPSTRARVQWNLCGVPVCRQNFAFLLGTNSRSITRAITGRIDLRRLRMCGGPTAQAELIDFFFLELYQSVPA